MLLEVMIITEVIVGETEKKLISVMNILGRNQVDIWFIKVCNILLI